MDYLFPGKLSELALFGNGQGSFTAPEPGSAVHVPWWEFTRLKPETAPQFDVIICNLVLCEMHRNSLGFTLNIARAMLSGLETPKAFVFSGWGLRLLSQGLVTERFYKSGFVLVHQDPEITVFAPKEGEHSTDFVPLPRSKKQITTSRALRLIRRIAGLRITGSSHPYDPPYHVSPSNSLSRAIVSGRQSETQSQVVGTEQINRFYTKDLGVGDLLTPDEHFLRLAGR